MKIWRKFYPRLTYITVSGFVKFEIDTDLNSLTKLSSKRMYK